MMEAREMKRWLIAVCVVMIASFTAVPVLACTLFAAVGPERVQGGGTLIAKNRDWRPQPQELRLVTKGTYRYYGIFAGDEGKRKQLKGGVNEKGLAVFSNNFQTLSRNFLSLSSLSALEPSNFLSNLLSNFFCSLLVSTTKAVILSGA